MMYKKMTIIWEINFEEMLFPVLIFEFEKH